jgi:hypothetical protein
MTDNHGRTLDMFRLEWKGEDTSHHFDLWKDIPEVGWFSLYPTEGDARSAAVRAVHTVARRVSASIEKWTAERPAHIRAESAERCFEGKSEFGTRHVLVFEQRYKGVDAHWNDVARTLSPFPNAIITAHFKTEFRFARMEARCRATRYKDGRIVTTYFFAPPGPWSEWSGKQRDWYGARVPSMLAIEVKPTRVRFEGKMAKARKVTT